MQTMQTTTEEDPLLTMEGIAERKGRSLSSVRHWRSDGLLPEPDLTFGPRRLLWRASTIDGWQCPSESWAS